MKLYAFLNEMLPERIPSTGQHEPIVLREDFIKDVMDGIAMAPMSIRLTPHIVSCIDVCHAIIPNLPSSYSKYLLAQM